MLQSIKYKQMTQIYIKYLFCLLVIYGSFLNVNIQAQERGACGVSEIQEYLANNPEARAQKEKALQSFVKDAQKFMQIKNDPNQTHKNGSGEYIIPVVFHNIYGDPNGVEYITADEVDAAMERLNQDFSGLTADAANNPDCAAGVNDPDNSLELDCNSPLSLSTPSFPNITFRLAEKDPNGNPSSGITRNQNDLTYASVGFGPLLREIVQWPRDQYLNVYIVYKSNGGSSGVAAYPEVSNGASEIFDGIAMPYWSFRAAKDFSEDGNFASTITHEIGHWLGLHHTWGEDGATDRCETDDFDFLENIDPAFFDEDNPADFEALINGFNDTPNCIGHGIHSGVCEVQVGSSCNGEAYYYDNFMDYTPCMRTFSPGQANYIECVLNSSLSDRKNIQDNLENALYINSNNDDIVEPRMVFEQATFIESSCDLGEISNPELGIVLEDTEFNINAGIINSDYYQINGLPSGLSTEVEIISATEAVLSVSGQFNLSESIEMTIVFQDISGEPPLFDDNVELENRTKVLEIDLHEDKLRGYHDVCPNFQVGPNSLALGSVQLSEVNAYLGYKESQLYLASNSDVVSFCVEENGGTNWIKTFNEGENIDANSGVFEFAPLKIGSQENGFINTDEIANTITDPDGYFYVGVKYELDCGIKYGWLRLQLLDCAENGMADIVLHDYQMEAMSDVTSEAGLWDQATLISSASILEESLNDDGTFPNAIKFTLEGTTASFKSDAEQYITIDGPNETELDFSINILSSKEIELSIDNSFNPTNIEQEIYEIDFSNAFTSSIPNLEIACNGLIKVDYYLPENSGAISPQSAEGTPFVNYLKFQRHEDWNFPIWEDKGRTNFFLQPLENVTTDCNNIKPGYVLYNSGEYYAQIQVLCASENSEEALLFETNTIPTTGVYKSTFDQEYTNTCDEDISSRRLGSIYFKTESLAPFAEEAYIALRILKTCGEVYYAWIKINTTTVGPPVFEIFFYSNQANNQIAMGETNGYTCSPWVSLADEPQHIPFLDDLSIDGVGEFDINNVSSGYAWEVDPNGQGYIDYTNMIAQVEAGNNYPVDLNVEGATDTDSGYWVYAWVNWDKDPFFEASELQFYWKNDSPDANPSIDVPADIANGNYKMRIIISRYGLSSFNGCLVPQYGEIEDYTIRVGDPEATEIPAGPTPVDLKVLLEGAQDATVAANEMYTLLNEYLPLTQPYNLAPYNYNGSEMVSSMPSNVVDWILVEIGELATDLDEYPIELNVVETQVGLLLSNGDIVDPSTMQALTFNNLMQETPYRVAIRHRNHLDIVSKQDYTIKENNIENIEIDFTVLANGEALVAGAGQLKQVGNTAFYAMYGGDYTQDGIIAVPDFDLWTSTSAILATYSVLDGTLDGIVQNTDGDLWIPNKAKIGVLVAP